MKNVKPWRIGERNPQERVREVPQAVAARTDDRELPRRVGKVPRAAAGVQGLELVVGNRLAEARLEGLDRLPVVMGLHPTMIAEAHNQP